MRLFRLSKAPDSTATNPQLPARRGFLKRLLAFTAGGAALAAVKPREARADGDPFVGEIAMVGFNFVPVGWAFCNGQILPISQYTALFSLLGTTYGGDGITNFGLPNLQGRVPIHFGQGPGLSPYIIGQFGGVEAVSLLTTQVPAHTHALNGSTANGTTDTPTGALPAKNASGVPSYGTSANAAMSAAAIGTTGGGQPHSNVQPYLAVNFIIALNGIFPSRS